jgi:transcriptional regulator with GAF, ATPase, and Fis domain
MGEGLTIELSDLGLPEVLPEASSCPPSADAVVSLPPGGVDYRDVERSLLIEALERVGWVQKDAAALLRMSRRRLNYRIRKLGITHPSWRRNRP